MAGKKAVFRIPHALPLAPKLKAALAEPPTALPQEKTTDDQQQKQQDAQKFNTPDFIQNYGDWRAGYPDGTVLDFLVWTYLVKTKQWQNHYEFEFHYPLLGGQAKADFYIHYDRLVWQIKGFIYGQRRNDALASAQEALMRKQRYKIVSLYEDDLIYRTDYTLENALNGQQALGRETPKGTGYAAN